MPLPADHFAPEMPLPYRAYLNALWDRLEKELRGTWANIRPGESAHAPTPTTKLENWREILKDVAGTDSVATVAKKAYQTIAGQRAIEHLTEAALAIPETIRMFPADLEIVQREYLQRLLKTIIELKDLIEEDRPIVSACEAHLEPGDTGTSYALDEECPPEQSVPAVSQPELPPGFWYSNALGDVLGDEINLRRVFDLEQSFNLLGRLHPYGLTRLLTTLEAPLRSKIEVLLPAPETTRKVGIEVRRTTFALLDALDDFAANFESGETGPLRRNAVVAAFVTALLNPYPSHKETLVRVGEMISRREKAYAKTQAT